MNLSAQNFFDASLAINPLSDDLKILSELPACKGVVLFADGADTPIQILVTSNIRSLVRNRLFSLQPDEPTRRARLDEIVRKVYYSCCYCDFASSLKHYRVAKVLFPQNYEELVTLPKLAFLRIDLNATWPNFSVVNKTPQAEGVKFFGPFANRRDTLGFKDAIEQGFLLCRRPDLVDDETKASKCPYLQMGICPAPCVGKISKDEYLEQIVNAVSAATGEANEQIKKLEEMMRQLAVSMRYEVAEVLKKQLGSAERLKDKKFKWVCDLNDFAVLHIDKWAKIKVPKKRKKEQTYCAFLITAGKIFEFDSFAVEQLGELAEQVEEKISSKSGALINEEFLLAGFGLYRGKTSGVWLDCRTGVGLEKIAAAIEQKFGDAGNQ